MTALADADRQTIARARELAAVGMDAICRLTGEDDPRSAYARMIGRLQVALGLVADIAERQDAEDARRLAEIRELLARFDWEHDDRQLALEAIERIAEGGEA